MQTSNLFLATVLIAEFLIGLLAFPRYIGYMKKLKLGQYIRQEGPDCIIIKKAPQQQEV